MNYVDRSKWMGHGNLMLTNGMENRGIYIMLTLENRYIGHGLNLQMGNEPKVENMVL